MSKKNIHPGILSSWLRPAIILLAWMALLVAPVRVSAHEVQPLKTEPAGGAVLAQSPTQVRLWFDEELDAARTTLTVVDASGKAVDAGKGGVDLDDASHKVLVVTTANLASGIYTVKWVAGLTDGDSAEGSFDFGVGNVTLISAVQPKENSSLPGGIPAEWVLIIVMVLILVSGMVWLRKRNALKA